MSAAEVPKKHRRYISSDTVTKTSAFLLPTLGIAYGVIKNYGFKNAYLGDRRLKDSPYPEYCLYLMFEHQDINKLEEVASVLREASNYVGEYDPSSNQMIIVMQMLEEWRHLRDVFVKGQYSDFDESYISKHYPKRVYAGVDQYGNALTKESINHLVLTRDNSLKEEIEEDLGVTLSDHYKNGELRKYQLMSKPDISRETIN